VKALWQRWWAAIVAAVLGLVAGLIVRGFLPPFVLDEPFWREFWTSPAAGGVFALIGAFIAFGAANRAASVHRRSAARQEWWDRAQWALDLARADKHSDRLIGLEALEGLKDDATEAEFLMILAVTEAVAPQGAAVDTEAQPQDNENVMTGGDGDGQSQ
jgi:hypothetical protein